MLFASEGTRRWSAGGPALAGASLPATPGEVDMPKRPCLDCGALSDGPRCNTDQQARDRTTLQAKRERRPRVSHAEDKRRAAAVAEHRRIHGDWCPGWQREGHPTPDLTADHVEAVAAGGAEGGDLQVLCRSCNGAKGHR